jgi:hypothetical protein
MRALLLTMLLVAVPAAASAGGGPPVYPGATPAVAPAELGLKPLPKSAKVYATADGFTKVRAWYRIQLKGSPELAQPGKEDSMDTFLLGSGPSAMALMVRSLQGKTWIVIAPPI